MWPERASRGQSRLLDFVLGSLSLLLCLPVLAVVAAVIRVCDGSPVLFRGVRLGQSGRLFTIYKFRTMRMRSATEEHGVPITRDADPRVTKIGRWLRVTKIDELPQLINVLKGDMGIVGPRPEAPELMAGCSDEVRRLVQYRPGLTSPASIQFRREHTMNRDGSISFYRATILPAKAQADLRYFANRTMWSDLVIVVRTVTTLFADLRGNRGRV